MSLADYTAVKASLGDWLHRSDITSQCDDFIDLFETEFNATMRVRQMEQQTTIASTTGYLVHPSSWLGWKEVKATSGGYSYHLEPVTDEIAVAETFGEGTSTTPAYYKVKGTKTYLYPSPGSGVNLPTTYWEGVSLSSGTNWLLTAYPAAYLYGALLQSAAYVGDDPRIPVWQQKYMQTLDAIKRDSQRGEWSGQALTMRYEGEIV